MRSHIFVMIRPGHLRVLALAALLGAALPAGAQDHAGDRDSHYRLGPNAPYHHYKHYRPPMTYYPRLPDYADPPLPAPRIDMRDPAGPDAPRYGLPPPALERVPRITPPR